MLIIEDHSEEKKRIDRLIAENEALRMKLHDQTARIEKLMADLGKARHDRNRYYDRILFEQGRHNILVKAYHDVCKRNKKLEALFSQAKGVIDGIKCINNDGE